MRYKFTLGERVGKYFPSNKGNHHAFLFIYFSFISCYLFHNHFNYFISNSTYVYFISLPFFYNLKYLHSIQASPKTIKINHFKIISVHWDNPIEITSRETVSFENFFCFIFGYSGTFSLIILYTSLFFVVYLIYIFLLFIFFSFILHYKLLTYLFLTVEKSK